jgi:hypothetical protein
VSVECGISLATLTALAHLALQGPNAMMSTFQQHQELIQRIADHKYRAHQFDSRGKVIVDLEYLASFLIACIQVTPASGGSKTASRNDLCRIFAQLDHVFLV